MAYKTKEDQAAASKRHYEDNKAKVRDVHTKGMLGRDK